MKKIVRISRKIIWSEAERRHALVGKAELWKMKQEFQFNFLQKQGLETSSTFCDIGCGTLRGGIPIIQYLEPQHYWGIDVRVEAINEAVKEVKRVELLYKKPSIIHAEQLSPLADLPKFDFIWAFSVLFHMTDNALVDALDFVKNHLEGDGCFYANVNIGDQPVDKWREFPVVWRSLEHYAALAAERGLSVSSIGTLRELGHDSGIDSQDDQVMLAFTAVR